MPHSEDSEEAVDGNSNDLPAADADAVADADADSAAVHCEERRHAAADGRTMDGPDGIEVAWSWLDLYCCWIRGQRRLRGEASRIGRHSSWDSTRKR